MILATFPLLWPPRKDYKRIQIRIQIHKSDSSILTNPLNGGPVKHTFIVQCFLKLAGRDCHILECPEHIGKLEPDELHIPLPPRFG